MGTEWFLVKGEMNQMVSFCDRLKEERSRLGMTQTAFGEIGGVTKKTQMLYESGDRAPDSVYLEKISALGVDVGYLVTGNRSIVVKPLNEISDQQMAAGISQFLIDALEMDMFELNDGVSFDFTVKLAVHCIRKAAGLTGQLDISGEAITRKA